MYCDGKAEFQPPYSFQSHDPLEIIVICLFGAQEILQTFLINVENCCAA